MPKKAGTTSDKAQEKVTVDIVPKDICKTCASWNPRTRCGEARIPVQVRSGVSMPRRCTFYVRREGLPELADNVLAQIRSAVTTTKEK